MIVQSALESSDESRRPGKADSGLEGFDTPLDDNLIALCDILRNNDGPVRHNLRATAERLVCKEQPSLSELVFMKEEARSLAALLHSYRLSDNGKIALAHRISLAVWEYYDSSWMGRRWTYDEVYFIPLDDHSGSRIDRGGMDATSPFIKMNFDIGEGEEYSLHSEYTQHRVAHTAPRIHALGVMLASIFGLFIEKNGENPFMVYNNQFASFTRCCKRLDDSRKPKYNWVEVEADSQQLRDVISNAVSACFDNSISRGGTSSLSERQNYLYEKIVWPFKHLDDVLNKRNSNRVACWYPKLMASAELSHSQPPPQMEANMTPKVSVVAPHERHDCTKPSHARPPTRDLINDDTFGGQTLDEHS
jgi:hypothetical protein